MGRTTFKFAVKLMNIRVLAFFGAVAIAVLGLIAAKSSSAQESTPPVPSVSLRAVLTGEPINDVRPRGGSSYVEFSNGTKVLDVSVDRLALPSGTILSAALDGNNIGTLTITQGRGFLRLSTMQGSTVPVPSAGSILTISRNSNIVLTGTFTDPPAPPVNAFFAPMTGDAIDGMMPRGAAHYIELSGDTAVKRLGVFVHRVNLPAGTILNVSIGNAAVGQIALNDDNEGGLRISTANGGTVPPIAAGTEIRVSHNDSTVVSGTFRAVDRPFPPHPRPNRVFGGRLNGREMVPPVQTSARGRILIRLNAEENQITVNLAFRGLSTDQTTATINGPALRGETGEEIFDLGTIGGTSGNFDAQTFSVTPEQVTQLRTGLWYVQIGSVDHPDGEIRSQIRSRHRRARFSGDGSDNIAVYRPSTGVWYVKEGTSFFTQPQSAASEHLVSGDFDGDGISDFAVFGGGSWNIRRSGDNGLSIKRFGLAGDIPMRGDYDGDGIADLAVFRPSTGVWYVQKSNGNGYIITQFGLNGDKPMAVDFDGDGLTDIAVFRPSNGTWYWLKSSNGQFEAANFGLNGDVPIAGDFDGDGADDLSVYRPSTGTWYALRSSNGTFDIRRFGVSSDVPAAADFDGDMVTDVAVFRPSTGFWYIMRSVDGTVDYVKFGVDGDIPATRH